MFLTHIRDSEFNPEWLTAIQYDPVHPGSATSPRRLMHDRNVFFLIEENIPTFVLCVAYTDFLPNSMDQLLNSTETVTDETARFAIFYSVFKTPTEADRDVQGSGADIILLASELIKNTNSGIEHFTTMSPIPTLRKRFSEDPGDFSIATLLTYKRDPVARFHINNGAKLMRIIRDADSTAIRQQQSWGIMANYDYTSRVLGPTASFDASAIMI